MAPLAWLLLLVMPALAAGDAAYEEKLLKDTFAALLERARFIKEESRLEGVKDLEEIIPFEGPITFHYMATPLVSPDCADDIVDGCSVMASIYCLGSEEGRIAAGTDIWRLAVTPDGKYDVNRAAAAIAHEIGHIRLRHSDLTRAHSRKLLEEWYPANGKDLAKAKQKREIEKHPKVLSQKDKDEINQAVREFVMDIFETKMAPRLQEFNRRKEAEADEYGYKLAESAGFAPGAMAGAFTQSNMSDFFSPTVKSKECVENDERKRAGGGSHASGAERDRRYFDRDFLGLSLE